MCAPSHLNLRLKKWKSQAEACHENCNENLFLDFFQSFCFRKRFEHQQKFLEEERKRRQFEEQKQKLRLLSSVKPKVCPKEVGGVFLQVFLMAFDGMGSFGKQINGELV